MSVSNNPNERLKNFLSQGTSDLRDFISQTSVTGNDHELDRLEKYYLYWKYYNGHHYRDMNHSLIQFNYVKAFINKINQFLLGTKAFTFEVKSLYTDVIDPEISRPIEEYIMYQWNRNNKAVTAHEILQTGSICGDVWVLTFWNATKKFVEIRVLDSRQCFPIFKDGDTSQLESFQVRTQLTNHPKKYKILVTNYTKDSIERWYQKGTQILKIQTGFTGVPLGDVNEYSTEPNPLKFIPIVHIKNRPQADSYFGCSDCQDILNLNKVYNEMYQELKGIIDYHATPTTVVTGATLKNATRSLGNIWSGLPPEANVFTLGLDADLSSMITYLDKLKVGMHEISDVPENVLGKIQAISGTSAAALQLTYLPLVQQADLKSLTYGEGIAEINENILRIGKKYDKKNERLDTVDVSDNASELLIYPVFTYGFPTDRMNMLQEGQMELLMKVGSRKELMNRLGKNNVESLMEEIDDDTIEQANIQAEANSIANPQPQQPAQ